MSAAPPAPAPTMSPAGGDARGAGPPKKDALDLGKYMGRAVRVKLQGGREVQGDLRGYDQLANLVLDECIEYMRDPCDPYTLTGETRQLGLVVCRGTQVSLICPVDGFEEIENPFLAGEG